MKISYNQLKTYINVDLPHDELSQILTDIGLEVEGIETFESVKGGMKGLIIGEVVTCEKHPNADKLSVTNVNIGNEELLPIVCGAPNVAAGQKVVVATVGTVLYDGDKKIPIKKGKIRGEQSLGMICAEDEIGIGKSHDGIIVLPDNVTVGTEAKDFYKIENDIIFEIGLTPNRADGASHYGVARDLYAYFNYIGRKDIKLTKPSVEKFKVNNKNLSIPVEIQSKACNRYAGVTVSGVTIKDSPKWLQNRLKAIGLQPINNIVDITNYVLHETGQPLHAFDADKILGKKVIIKTMPDKTKFTTLDEVERELHSEDLMICNTKEPMCIAGVFGGAKSGITDNSVNIFLESAYFNPVSVRKTSKRHALQTDASFRFERGVDINNVIYALKRATLLIQELAGGEVSSEIFDVYPTVIEDFTVELNFSHVDRLIGKHLPHKTIESILKGLDIRIIEKQDDSLKLQVPSYRVDVTREADVIEDILRIYGYNNIEIPLGVKSTLSYAPNPDKNKLQNTLSNLLSSIGFSEAMSNSLTKQAYYETGKTYNPDNSVKVLNPLSQDLNVMRQSLLHGSLEAVTRNIHHRTTDVKIFEFGNSYSYKNENRDNPLHKYTEKLKFCVVISGNKNTVNWNTPEAKADFYYLKSVVENLFSKLNFDTSKFTVNETEQDVFAYGLGYSIENKALVNFGSISNMYLSQFDIKQDVFYAEFDWGNILNMLPQAPQYKQISKFPAVKRDLALLLNKDVKFSQIEAIAYKTERKLLKKVSIFDVFEDQKLGNKKSYAVSFILQNETKTLKDKEIDKVMKKLQMNFEKQLGAELR